MGQSIAPDKETALPRRVFISYRHENSAAYAKLIYDRLGPHFPNSVFRDFDSIGFGEDIVKKIDAAVASCGALLALIDPTWISVKDANGRRLDNPMDFVRLEIASALRRQICVIPVLLNGTPMPSPEQLPEDLVPLTLRRALRISDESFDYNTAQLTEALDRVLSRPVADDKHPVRSVSTTTEHLGRALSELSRNQSQDLPITSSADVGNSTDKSKPKNRVFLASLAIAICILAQVLLPTMHHFLLHRFGFQVVRELAIAMFVVTLGAYVFGFHSLYVARPRWHKFWPISALIACLVAAMFTNVMLKSWPKLDDALKREVSAWVDRVFENQNENGGIRTDLRSPDAPDQVWTTAQCLEAVLVNPDLSIKYADRIRAGFRYIEQNRHKAPLQHEDGWGYTLGAPRTLSEISAWVSLAYMQSLRDHIWNEREKSDVLAAVERELRLLDKRQDPSGGWRPILENGPSLTRTYSTLMALWSYVEAEKIPVLRERLGPTFQIHERDGIQWLLSTYRKDVGWVPNPNRKYQQERYPGLNAQVLYVLSLAEVQNPYLASEDELREAKLKFVSQRDLMNLPANSDTAVPSGDQHLTDDFTAEGSQFLWYPWAVSAYRALSEDRDLPQRDRNAAIDYLQQLLSQYDVVSHQIDGGQSFILAENLFGISESLLDSSAPQRP